MKKINLTNPQIFTCKELLKDKILGTKLEIRYCEMYMEEAIHNDCEETEEKQRKALRLFTDELAEIEALYTKFE